MRIPLQLAMLCVGIAACMSLCEPGLVAHWTFDEKMGDSLRDVSGNNNNGKVYYSSWAPGKTGNSLFFTGRGSFVHLFHKFQLPKFTILAWVKPESIAIGGHIIYSEMDNHDEGRRGMIFGFIDGKLFLSFRGNNSGELSTVDADVSSMDGGWHCVAATYDSADAVLYLDGREIARKTFNSPIVYVLTCSYIGIDAGPDDHKYYSGNIDEMSIYNDALDKTAIASLYEALSQKYLVEIKNGPEARPVFSWSKVQQPYSLVIANNPSFTHALVRITVSDTTFQPSFDLPVGPIYWKISEYPDGTLIGYSGFTRTGVFAHWSFNEGTGDTVSDASGKDFKGKIFNGAWDIGKKGNSLLFNGEATYVRFDSTNAFKQQDFTLIAWIKAIPGIDKSGQRPVFSNTRAESGVHEGMNFGYDNGKLRLAVAPINGEWFAVTTDDSIVDNQWHCIAAACDGATMRVYRDGKQLAGSPFTTLIEYGANPPAIGALLNCSVGGNFAGNIDEFTLYNIGLGAAEISAVYDSVKRNYLHEIGDGAESRPLFSWTPVSPPYCLYAARDLAFTQTLFQITTSDTAYRPSAALSAGPVCWKVGYGFPDTSWIGSSRFIVKGLAAYWNFDEGTGDILHDRSGNGCDGKVSRATWTIGKKGNALFFNDTGASVVMDNSKGLALQQFTIAAWVKLGAIKGRQIIFSNMRLTYIINEGMSFELADGRPLFTYARNNGIDQMTLTADTALAGEEWHFTAMTCNGAEVAFFIDGREISRKPFNTAVYYGVSSASIGKLITEVVNRPSNFTGTIDELSVYHGALDPSEIKAVYDAVSRYFLHEISAGKNRRPVFSWEKTAPPYYVVVVKDFFFRDEVLRVSVSDTAYTPLIDLPTGLLYWKTGYGSPDTSWIGISSLEIYPNDAVIVPEEYSTVTEAIKHGSTILVRSNLNENMIIADAHVTIAGPDTGITITGKARITNSTVVFQNIKLAGVNGISPPNVSSIEPNPCPSPSPGTDGDTALIAANSTITLKNSSCKEGIGGKGNWALGCSGTFCSPCAFGSNGKDGLAVKASKNTTIDLVNSVLGTVDLDETSKITGVSSIAPKKSIKNAFSPLSFKVLSSQKIVFNQKTEFTVDLYTVSGRLLSKQAIIGNCCIIPKLNRGIYLMTINVHNSLFRYKLVNM